MSDAPHPAAGLPVATPMAQPAAPAPVKTAFSGAAPATPPSTRDLEEQTTAAQAAQTGIPYFDTRDLPPIPDVSDELDLDTLRDYRVAPLHRYDTHGIELGLTQHTDRTRLPELQTKAGAVKLTFKTISPAGFNSLLNHTYYNMFQAERDGDFELFGKKLAESPPKRAFQYIAQLAYWLGASDIHIEPQTEAARIRFRLDGVLHPITTVALNSYKIFLSDLQTRAEIKWGSDTPQSGRISYNLMSHQSTVVPISMRIETIPTFHGEEIVVRIFNNEGRMLNLDGMGFTSEQVKRLETVTTHPNGMVLAVGPTGSGKTSTMYALVNRLNSPEVKVITLEDPVEYDLPGISQVPVHTEDADSFAAKFRAVMREDPNVVMIGEIRDIDTAKTALQAALTGHLVLSTFHAVNAGSAISRMLDMTSGNPLFASAIRLIVAQRLARRVCTHCKVTETPTAKQLAFIKETLASIPAERRPKVVTSGANAIKLAHGKGCAACHGLGYEGRIAIVEMMPITPDIEKLMVAVARPTAQDLEAVAVKNGMITLQEDGLSKALQGITTIDEIISLT